MVPVAVAGTVALAACGTRSAGPVYRADEVRTPAAPTTTAVVVPLTTVPPAPSPLPPSMVVFDRLSSPENATAEIVGSGATAGDVVTVDGVTTEFMSFEVTTDDGFVARVFIADEGAHTVCVSATCGRVYTLDPDAESIDEVGLKIDEARAAATAHFDFAGTFPEWTVATAGPFSGTGGTTDAETKTVTIYSNRERSVDDFTRTILHEWGHVLDAERLTDEERATYLGFRGISADAAWTIDDDHSIEAWAQQPGEDFAEVMAMFWSDGDYLPRTTSLAPPPTADELAGIAALVDL